MQYQLDVVATSIEEVVTFAGGWLFDRAMAGWDVTVLIPMCHHPDLRPLQILGAKAADLEAAFIRPQRCPAALSVVDQMYVTDRRVRDAVHNALDSGLSEVALWGEQWPLELNRRLTFARHELSAAARTFKAHAFVAGGISTASVDLIETFRIASRARQVSTVLTVAR